MQTLDTNWVTEGLIDFEYKKYKLLAYLQTAEKNFSENKIYPFLADLVSHYRNLTAFKENKDSAEKNFPQNISRVDIQNFKLHYEKMLMDDKYMEEIQSIIDFAIPEISTHIEIGKEIYDDVEYNIDISAIGLIPLNNESGYILLKHELAHDTCVFQYELTIFENMYEKFRGLKTVFIENYPNTLYNYEEAIKMDILKKNKALPNPATYLLYCKKFYPFTETFFPVAKRRFVRFLQEGKA